MCLIAFAINADPHCPLLIAANRDEAWDRPSAALARWALPNGQAVIAGRDLRDGGTWLGLTPSGRVAMLTNVRDAQPAKAPRSRGELVTRWLQGDADWADFSGALLAQDYGGFNLVVGDFTQGFWACVSNRHPKHPHRAESTPRLHTLPLGAGVYGLSNAALDTPWPKTLALKSALASRVAPLATEADKLET
uniref:NRDE family protein n=1 Tax=Hydrogenophaga sp. TaxID=1904254 RepID=UPI003561741F